MSISTAAPVPAEAMKNALFDFAASVATAGAAAEDKGRSVFVDHVIKVPVTAYGFGRSK